MRLLKIIGVGLHLVVNVALILVLLGLGALAVVLLREGEPPVPRFLTVALDEALAKEGFRLETDELKLDVRGMVIAHNARIYSMQNSEAFFDAELVFARFSLFGLLVGDFIPTEVSIADGKFYCPTVISPAGKREIIVHNIHINASRRAKEWQIETFIFQLLNARVQIAGNFFTPLPGLDEEDSGIDKDAEPDFVGAYFAACRSLMELREPLAKLQQPILNIVVSGERKGPLHVLAEVFNEGYVDEESELVLGAGSVRVSALLDEDAILRPDGMGRAWLDSLKWRDDVKTGFTEALVELDSGIDGLIGVPRAAELYSYSIEAWGLPFNGAFANINLRELKKDPKGALTGEVRLKSGADWLAVRGRFKPSDQSGRLRLDAEWNPEFFLTSTAIPPEDIPEGLDIVDRPRWKAWVDFLPGFKPADAQFDVRFGELSYDDLHLVAARVQGRVNESELDLQAVDLMTKDYRVKGDYWQDFSSGKYRFHANGTVWPKDLNAFITDS
ncbi:MAG: hypothetical protein ACQKBV_13660, partial [Puniceicoccales bacterium]